MIFNTHKWIYYPLAAREIIKVAQEADYIRLKIQQKFNSSNDYSEKSRLWKDLVEIRYIKDSAIEVIRDCNSRKLSIFTLSRELEEKLDEKLKSMKCSLERIKEKGKTS